MIAPTTRCSAAIPPGAHALHWNEDGFEPPPGAVEVYARPPGGRAEGFRVGRRAWGVQFHPEVDAAALDGWYRGVGRTSLDPAGVTEADARAGDARHLPRSGRARDRDLRRLRGLVRAGPKRGVPLWNPHGKRLAIRARFIFGWRAHS